MKMIFAVAVLFILLSYGHAHAASEVLTLLIPIELGEDIHAVKSDLIKSGWIAIDVPIDVGYQIAFTKITTVGEAKIVFVRGDGTNRVISVVVLDAYLNNDRRNDALKHILLGMAEDHGRPHQGGNVFYWQNNGAKITASIEVLLDSKDVKNIIPMLVHKLSYNK